MHINEWGDISCTHYTNGLIANLDAFLSYDQTYQKFVFNFCWPEISFLLLSLLQTGQWHAADEYDGQIREIKFRSLCSSPMCPPDTAMTEYQHAFLLPDKKLLVMHVSLSCLQHNQLFCHHHHHNHIYFSYYLVEVKSSIQFHGAWVVFVWK